MSIVFDEVVGNVTQGDDAAGPAPAPEDSADRREPTLDREALHRELRMLKQRAARLCAE